MPASKIRNQEYEEVVRRHIADGWTSESIATYLKARYQVEIDDSTIRLYRSKEMAKIEKEYPDLVAVGTQRAFAEKNIARDTMIDTLGELQQLIRMQRARIDIDVKTEAEIGKLFVTTRGEIKLYAELLSQYHEELQDWGVVPKAGTEVTLRVNPEHEATFPVIDLFEEEDLEQAMEFSELVWRRTKQLNGS